MLETIIEFSNFPFFASTKMTKIVNLKKNMKMAENGRNFVFRQFPQKFRWKTHENETETHQHKKENSVHMNSSQQSSR